MPNNIYFHVNKRPNILPPESPDFELMKQGQQIKVGDEVNPFFRRWKNEIPFKVYGSETFPNTLPFNEFLENLVKGEYNEHAEFPGFLWNPLMVYLGCLSELVLESIRIKEFKALPSRQRCLWLIKTLDEAVEWASDTSSGNKHQIVRVRVEGKIFECDASLLNYENQSLSDMEETARLYWLGKQPFEREEILFEGNAEVIEVLSNEQP